MTHPLVSRFRRPLAAIAALGALALGLALVAGPASAAPLHFAPETFTIQFDNSPVGHGFATGPVRGGFTDHSASATDDVFTFGFGPFRSTVNVEHSAVEPPALNPRSCTGFAYVPGSWRMNGLTGEYADALGFGHFAAWEFASAPRDRYGYGCDLRHERLVVYVSARGEAANPHHHF